MMIPKEVWKMWLLGALVASILGAVWNLPGSPSSFINESHKPLACAGCIFIATTAFALIIREINNE